MEDWNVNLTGCTDAILQDLSIPKVTQADVALTYAMSIKSASQGADKPDWKVINEAIIARWSHRGLERVKKMALDLLSAKGARSR